MSHYNLMLTNRGMQDLNPLLAGWENCEPGHSFGPAVRSYTLIHYVRSGKGVYYLRGQAYPVHAGQAFLILPNEITTYTADSTAPWHYQWVGFDGELSTRFRELPPVFSIPEAIFRELAQITEDATAEYRIAALLFRLYAELFTDRSPKNRHVQRVQDYIRAAYMQNIRVQKLADEMGLDRHYLSRLFRENTGQSIQDYLVTTRLEEAARLLLLGHSVQDAALLCGYEDVSNFSKMFKKKYGKSPANWRNFELH